MKKKKLVLIISSLLLTVVLGTTVWKSWLNATDYPPTDQLHKPTNAVYYWRTTFNPSDEELDFMKKHDVGRLYLRMFDVVQGAAQPEPNASVCFGKKVPKGLEIVPTVYITVEVMRNATGEEDLPMLATKIVDRIERMCQWNEVGNWHEMQLDCDWTEETRDRFFRLCQLVRERLPKDKLLSSTIRLHQLTEPAPPVDCGVLMVYNTDNFRDPRATNSILNDSTVEQYLRQKLEFDLPLDIALPIYQWNLILDKQGHFLRISNSWECEDDEVMKFERVPFPTLERTLSHLNKYLGLQRGRYSKVLYHLDEKNIKNYSDEEIKALYDN